MELSELKSKLLNKEKILLPLLFINEDESEFLIKSYIKEIANVNKLEVKEIATLKEMLDIQNDVFFNNDYLFIYRVNKNDIINVDDLTNIILINEDKLDLNINTVKFNKLLEWQIEDYVKVLLPGLDKAEISWLCKICKYDILRLTNEANKLNIFDKKDQEKIFQLINSENGYCDLNELTVFNLTNAITKKDYVTIHKVFRDIDNIDVEGTGVVTLLLNQFKNIINIQLNPRANATSLGMSEKQFRAIQYNCNKYSSKELVDMYEFLTGIDYKLKMGDLEMTNNELNTYILSHILN